MLLVRLSEQVPLVAQAMLYLLTCTSSRCPFCDVGLYVVPYASITGCHTLHTATAHVSGVGEDRLWQYPNGAVVCSVRDLNLFQSTGHAVADLLEAVQ